MTPADLVHPQRGILPAAGAGVLPDRQTPGWRDLLEMAVAAIAMRAAFFWAVALRFHVTFHEWAIRDDGSSYVAFARALLGDPSKLTEYDQRVFPGYPALIALLNRVGMPLEAAAVGSNWVGAALVSVMGATLFRDRRIGWALTCLPLQYFINSSLAMSETPMLALTLAGLLLARPSANARSGLWKWPGAIPGIFFGLAGLVRPMACFAVIGQFFQDISARRYRRAIAISLVAGGVVLLGMLALRHWTGDALRGVKVYANAHDTYNGHLIQWPGYSLVNQSRRPRVPLLRVVYIWFHVGLTLIAMFAVIAQCARHGRRADPRDLLAAPWLAANTLFVLCIGSYWGFEHFPRFTIPALPAMLWALRGILPRQRWPWGVIAVTVVGSAVMVVMHNFVIPD